MSSDKEDRDPVRRPRPIGRPQMPPGPLADLKALIYELYLAALPLTLDEITSSVERFGGGLKGNPQRDTINRIIGDPGMPASQADVLAVVTVLAREARWDEEDAVRRARDLWVAARMATPAGVPLAEVTDPFALEVHRPVHLEDAPPKLPLLPLYVPRKHDQTLGQVVRTAAGGRSGIAVLVGGSSTGKTRACWEALQPLRQVGGWRLWHPYDPTRPEAVLQGLPNVRPRTVVWLNETQECLAGESGERVAAGLRALLADTARAPVLVLGTLWPDHYAALTHRDGSQVRQMLDGTVIEVPTAFTGADLTALQKTATADDRLAWAAEHSEDGQVTQYLAGGPALLERYYTALPAARALMDAAMDTRRLGMGAGLPQAFLEAAAPGYLTDTEWDALGEDWLEQALAYTAVPAKGAHGPLTRIRPRPATRAARDRGDQPASTAAAAGPLYRLADYLDQHGRAHRASQIPPASFWSAAAAHVTPGHQAALGDAAHARGLYRDAAQLYKNAAASGDPRAVGYLSDSPACLRADPRPALWAAAHAPLDDPDDVARLLDSLRETGAHEQAATLLADRTAANAPLDNPYHVARLLDSLREAGAHEQTAALAARAAAHAALDIIPSYGLASLLDSLRRAGAHEQTAALAARVGLDNPDTAPRPPSPWAPGRRPAARQRLPHPRDVPRLLDELREAGAHEQITALLALDPAAHAPLDDPYDVAELLDSLREAGAHEQITALLARDPAAHAPLDDVYRVARLLDSLRKAGAHEQITALLARDPAAHAPLCNPDRVARLLDSLRKAGAHEQITALLARDPAAHAPLCNPDRVARLLDSLRKAGAHEQITALLALDPAAHAPLDDPYDVAELLDSLRKAGAHEQITALLARDPAAHGPLHNPYHVDHLMDDLRGVGVARLLDSLREAGAHEQATALAARLPAAGMFRLLLEQKGLAVQFRFGREADGTPAAPWGWEDLDLWPKWRT